MASTLTRGLNILALLNRQSSATVAELEQSLRIPRATVYRILATLVREGFVYQHSSGDGFRISEKVRVLSEGLTDKNHLASLMRPFMEAATEQLRWPVAFCTLSGVDLVLQDNTDDESPLAADRFRIGYRMPVLTTASGRCILAHLAPTARTEVIERLAAEGLEAVPTGHDRTALEQQLTVVRRQGFSVYHRQRQHTEASTIAVPVAMPGSDVPAALTIRYARAAVTLPVAIRTFVPVLKQSAASMIALVPAPRGLDLVQR